MERLPKDVLVEIALGLDVWEVLEFCQTSKKTNKLICQNKFFWGKYNQKKCGIYNANINTYSLFSDFWDYFKMLYDEILHIDFDLVSELSYTSDEDDDSYYEIIDRAICDLLKWEQGYRDGTIDINYGDYIQEKAEEYINLDAISSELEGYDYDYYYDLGYDNKDDLIYDLAGSASQGLEKIYDKYID